MASSGVYGQGGNSNVSTPNPITGQTNQFTFSNSPTGVANGNLITAGAQAQPIFNNLSNLATQAAGQTQTNFNQYTPTLNSNFSANPALDSMSQGLLAQGQQAVAQQTAGQQASIRQQFGASPVANVLQRQAAISGNLQANPLLFQAGANQISRNNNAQQLSNNTMLQQQQASTAGATNTNAAVGQQFGLNAVPAQAYQQLMSTLGGIAQQFK